MGNKLFNDEKENFKKLFGGGTVYQIPTFQRDYSWDEEQWEELWEDICDAIDSNYDHYMGYLVLEKNETQKYNVSNDTFTVIDGQQRLTTITIIILSAIHYIKSFEMGNVKNEEKAEILINDYIGKKDPLTLDSYNKLILNKNNNSYYKSYLSVDKDISLNALNESCKLMKKCYEYYCNMIKNSFHAIDDIIKFVNQIVDKLFFTKMIMTDKVSAYKVFETLNARGVDLSTSDLLKNYLFSISPNITELQINSLEAKWQQIVDSLNQICKISDYVYDFWVSKYKYSGKKNLYKEIKNNIKTDAEMFEFINDLADSCYVYAAIRNPEDDLWNDNNEIKDLLKLIELFGLKQCYPVILSTYINCKDKLTKVLTDIVNVTFRYTIICKKNPNELASEYNNLSIDMYNTKLYNRDILKNSKIYVSDDSFVLDFRYKEFTPSNRNHQIVKYIFDEISNKLGYGHFNKSKNTIEHILDKNLDNPSKWGFTDKSYLNSRYRIGNMLPLESNINVNLQNLSYKEKLSKYANSNIQYVKSFVNEYKDWSEEIIDARQVELAKIAKEIWKLV